MTPGNPFSSVATGLGSGLTLVIKICEYTYALRAVDQQTQEYLITAQHAWENIKTCRRLLSQRIDVLPVDERREYERVINEAKTAADAVTLLLDQARVDKEADQHIHLSTRALWVLSNNPNMTAALHRLDIVHTTLTQNIATLRLLSPCQPEYLSPVSSNDRPPTYKDSELLAWKRQTRAGTSQPSTPSLRPHRSSTPVPDVRQQNEHSPSDTGKVQNGGRHFSNSSSLSCPADFMVSANSPLVGLGIVDADTDADTDAKPLSQPPPPSRHVSAPTLPTPSTPKPNGSDDGGGGLVGGARSPRSWLEYQAMRSSKLRRGQPIHEM